jgi:hypothetical protein
MIHLVMRFRASIYGIRLHDRPWTIGESAVGDRSAVRRSPGRDRTPRFMACTASSQDLLHESASDHIPAVRRPKIGKLGEQVVVRTDAIPRHLPIRDEG